MGKIIPILLLFASTLCYGQGKKSKPLKNDVFGLYYFMSVEKQIVDNSEVNSILRAKNIPEAILPELTLGYGIEWYMNRFIITISHNGMRKTQKPDSATARVILRSTSFNIGYDVIKHPNISLYPYAGIKSCATKYLFREKSPDTALFINHFNSTTDYKDISSQRMHLDLGIGLAFQSFVMIDLRGGVLIALDDEKWYYNKIEFANAPQTQYKGYITLNIGLGAFDDGKSKEKPNGHRLSMR